MTKDEAQRPGWIMLDFKAAAFDEETIPVMTFEAAVMVQTGA